MKNLFFVLFVLSAFVVNAQQTLSGLVLDDNTKSALSGASVSINGRSVGRTDKAGKFSVSCEPNARIVVSYVGYLPYTATVANCGEVLNISLTAADQSLDMVEITATSTINKTLLHQPASITKLDKTEIRRGAGLFLDDAINANVPGVTMNRRSVSAGQQFNIRGYGNGVGFRGASNNFDGQGYKVYLNGIPVTDAEGMTIMDDIDFGSIGNVEVVKGPAGTLYGLAIAGAVNLETVKPAAGEVSVGQDVLVGNYGLRRYTTHLKVGTERSSILVNYGKQLSDGFMSHSASHKDFVNVAATMNSNARQQFNAYFGYANSYDERGGELTIDQYLAGDYSGNARYIKNNAHSEVIGFRAGLGHLYQFSPAVSNRTTVFVSGNSNNASSAGGWTDKTPLNFGLRSSFDTRFNLSSSLQLSGITGVETQRQQNQTIGYAMVADSSNLSGYNRIGAIRSNQYTITATTSLFTEWTLSFPKALSVTAGLGWSNMSIELNDRLFSGSYTTPKQYAKTFNGMLSPHLAINKVFNEKASIYAAYSKGYKAPVSSQFFIAYTGELNTDLVPEEGDQFEIGSKGKLVNGKLDYQLAVFNAIFSNKMTAVAVTSGNTTLYSYIANSGSLNNKGIEVALRYTAWQSAAGPIRLLQGFGNLTYSDFTYDDFQYLASDYSGKAVAGVAPVVANLGIDLRAIGGLYGNIVYNYKDGMPISSDGLNNTHSYNLLNAKLGIQRDLGKHFNLDAFFGASNITGTQYYYMVFVNQLPDAYLPAPDKANYFGGINLNYIF